MTHWENILPTYPWPLVSNIMTPRHSTTLTPFGGCLADMATTRADLLQGTLDLLILKTLALEPMHGWGVSKRIRQMSSGVLEVNQGSLYPAFYRLRDRGLIESRSATSDEGRSIKVYSLTRKGSAALEVQREGWRLFAGAVEEILATG